MEYVTALFFLPHGFTQSFLQGSAVLTIGAATLAVRATVLCSFDYSNISLGYLRATRARYSCRNILCSTSSWTLFGTPHWRDCYTIILLAGDILFLGHFCKSCPPHVYIFQRHLPARKKLVVSKCLAPCAQGTRSEATGKGEKSFTYPKFLKIQ